MRVARPAILIVLLTFALGQALATSKVEGECVTCLTRVTTFPDTGSWYHECYDECPFECETWTNNQLGVSCKCTTATVGCCDLYVDTTGAITASGLCEGCCQAGGPQCKIRAVLVWDSWWEAFIWVQTPKCTES